MKNLYGALDISFQLYYLKETNKQDPVRFFMSLIKVTCLRPSTHQILIEHFMVVEEIDNQETTNK